MDDLNASIQDGVDEVCAFSGCIYKSASLDFIPNKTYYDLPSLLPDYIGLVALFNTVVKRWMIPTSSKKLDRERIDWEACYGTPWWFVPINYRYMAIFRKPISAYGKMYIYYIAAAPTLTDDIPIPIPDDHITALEQYTLTDLWEQNQEISKASENIQMYISNLEELRVYMRNKRNSDRYISLRD